MKNALQILKYLIVLAILCIFPMCISSVIEYAVSHDISFTFEYLPLWTLMGALLSAIFFSSQNVVHISVYKPKVKLILPILGIGMTLKQSTLYLLCLTIGMHNTGSFDLSFFSLTSMLIISPLAEEIIFRGILPDILNPKKSHNKIYSVVIVFVSSLIWTLIHLYGISISSLLLFMDGIIMTSIYMKYKNLILTVLYHFATNASILIFSFIKAEYYGIAIVICLLILIASFLPLFCSKP